MPKKNKFTPSVANDIGRSAMFVCSNPDCLRLTGFENEDGRPRAIAEAAHITSASPDGPQREGEVLVPGTNDPVDPRSSANGIWLCRNCHKVIDGDVKRFPSSLLATWKRTHVERMRSLVGRDLESSLLALRGDRMYHQESRELLVHLSDRRFLFNEMANENPKYVEESVLVLRNEVRNLQGRVSPASRTILSQVLESVAASILTFLNDAGDDIRSIIETSGLDRFDRFSSALSAFRFAVAEAVKPLADELDLRAEWIDDALVTRWSR